MHEALRREDALRARTRAFRGQVARSMVLLEEALQTVRAPYLALSGGKDSLVALWLACQMRPGLTAVWVDDELEHTETPATVRQQTDQCGARLVLKTGTQRHAGWFTPWREEPFWRQPEADCLITRQSIRRLAVQWGHDGVIVGTRASESTARRIAANRWGPLHAPAHARLATIAPLQRWAMGDVWAAIAEWAMPYHPAYDAMSRAGIDRERQRVGPLCLAPGWVLDAAWPGLRRALEERYGPRW